MSYTQVQVQPGKTLRGTTSVPGDKSLSHRALMLSGLADGPSQIRGFLPAGDTLATLHVMEQLGVPLDRVDDHTLTIHGRGLHGLQASAAPLNCVNAGTAIRLLAGLMAGQSFASILDGSDQLRRRPMGRITQPLRLMGAQIEDTAGRAPLKISPAPLHGIAYKMPVASAQVKSGILLAGLYADSPTTVIEPGPARDHTERMLRARGVEVHTEDSRVTVVPPSRILPLDMTIPCDMSSAAFLLVAGCCCAANEIQITGVNTNPTRTGILDILAAMGGTIQIVNPRDEGGEPVADLIVHRADLHGATIGGAVIVRAIDEFPVLMVAATQAHGATLVCDAAELRVKETDRIAVMAGELRKMGAEIEEHPDGFLIQGPQSLRGAVVDGHDDHRVAMSLVIAGLCAEGETRVQDARCIEDSFPGFVETLQALGADLR